MLWRPLCSLVLWTISMAAGQQQDPCTVTDGDHSHLILRIVESNGSQTSQVTDPAELPIAGSLDEIVLSIVPANPNSGSEQADMFRLDGKQIRLAKPLDRDAEDLSTVVFQITCTDLTSGRRRTIPVVVAISDINDNPPIFQNTPYVLAVPENTTVGTVVFKGLLATDPDSNVNGQVEYRVVDGGNDHFEIDSPHQGLLSLKKQLDYETNKRHYLTIVASDRAVDKANRFTATTTLIVNVIDSDDQDPAFSHDLYEARTVTGESQALPRALEVRPEKIRAEDQDTLRTEVRYTLETSSGFFAIDAKTGVVSQVRPVETLSRFELVVKATENVVGGRSATARLAVDVEAEDTTPPVLEVSDALGYVDEHAALGTKVNDANGSPLRFTVSDIDKQVDGNSTRPLSEYTFEITTSFFTINSEGFLVVNQPDLDRDPPATGKLGFQIFAREVPVGMGAATEAAERKTSAPVSLVIVLKDINDNPPVLVDVPYNVLISAGSSKRVIATLNATDNDFNSRLEYRLLDVTGSAGLTSLDNKFKVDPLTGDVSVIARVAAGERYSLTVGVFDQGGKSSRSVMEVEVAPSPNLRGPQFSRVLYESTLPEDSAKFTPVVTVAAKDPEEAGPVKYAFAGDDKVEEDLFEIEETTGTIRVMKSLDRETSDRHVLRVVATDTGGMSSTATVHVSVSDVNDQTPAFVGAPYSFRVKEGDADAVVGAVTAKDADVGSNAVVSYAVNDDDKFSVDADSGEIRTMEKLDFEQQAVHYVVVTATDGVGSSTATVTVLVQDAPDEDPVFLVGSYEATVPEDAVMGTEVVRVEAFDQDSEPSITYRIVSGDVDKFAIDPSTGVIRTTGPLDFERRRRHSLVVGTEESRLTGSRLANMTATVEVEVTDVNDVAPEFFQTPRANTIQVRNDVAPGQVIGLVRARDGDGSPEHSRVRYRLSESRSSDYATKYFAVDEDTGDITLKGDLKQELYEIYHLSVIAYDSGEPEPLTAEVTIVVHVLQVVTVAPGTGIGFVDTRHAVTLDENLQEGLVVYSVPLERNVDDDGRELSVECTVEKVTADGSGAVEGMFFGRISGDACQIVLMDRKQLDREVNSKLTLEIALKTLSAFANKRKSKASVDIQIRDLNDNRPEFVFQDPGMDVYLVTIPDSVLADTSIFRVKATDQDPSSTIRYELSDSNPAIVLESFAVDPTTGHINILKDVQALKEQGVEFPVTVMIAAMDNPNDVSDALTAVTVLKVKILRPEDGVVLTVANIRPRDLAPREAELVALIESQTGLTVEVDRMVESKYPFNNGTCCRVLGDNTDVYMHFIDPTTNDILPYNHPTLQRHVTGKQAASNIKYTLSSELNVQASDIHPPFKKVLEAMARDENLASRAVTAGGPGSEQGFGALPAVLIAIGCIVFALAVGSIIYLLCIRRRYERTVEKTPKTIIVPRYEPVFVGTNLKEYETQVLQMSVPIDSDNDESFRKKKTRSSKFDFFPSFHLDNISYITKDRTNDSLSTVNTSSFHSAGGGGGGGVTDNFSSIREDTTDFYSVVNNNNNSSSSGYRGKVHQNLSSTEDDLSDVVVFDHSTPIRRPLHHTTHM